MRLWVQEADRSTDESSGWESEVLIDTGGLRGNGVVWLENMLIVILLVSANLATK
jgi:hypothetical protein